MYVFIYARTSSGRGCACSVRYTHLEASASSARSHARRRIASSSSLLLRNPSSSSRCWVLVFRCFVVPCTFAGDKDCRLNVGVRRAFAVKYAYVRSWFEGEALLPTWARPPSALCTHVFPQVSQTWLPPEPFGWGGGHPYRCLAMISDSRTLRILRVSLASEKRQFLSRHCLLGLTP